MAKPRVIAALAVSAFLTGQITASECEEATCSRDRPTLAGYLPAWATGPAGPIASDVPAERLTHVLYAFGGVSEGGLAVLGSPCLDLGECPPGEASGAPGGNFAKLAVLKQQHEHLKLMISIGGWGGAKYLSDAAATADARARFVASAIDLYISRFPGLFDGIDVDWEFPVEGGMPDNIYRPEDGENLTLLMAEFRKQLSARRDGKRFELSVAVSAFPPFIKHLQLGPLARMVDRLKVMTYDYHAGSKVAHFNGPLFAATDGPASALNVDASIQAYLDSGVPAKKLMLGIPFYGRGYGNVGPNNHGLFQKGDPEAAQEWGAGTISYRELRAKRPEEHGFEGFWHGRAQAPWLYNPDLNIWISYDDPASVERKAAYAAERGLGGIFIWDLTGDDGSLIPAILRGLGLEPS